MLNVFIVYRILFITIIIQIFLDSKNDWFKLLYIFKHQGTTKIPLKKISAKIQIKYHGIGTTTKIAEKFKFFTLFGTDRYSGKVYLDTEAVKKYIQNILGPNGRICIDPTR